MAAEVTFNEQEVNLYFIYKYDASLGTYSADLKTSTAFDYFDDNATAGDCIYFSQQGFSCDILFEVGTALVADAITLVWEYYDSDLAAWTAIPNLHDDTNSFQTLGANYVYWDLPVEPCLRQTNLPNYPNWCQYRVRISAVTNITEGGAQANNTVKHKIYAATPKGYTAEVPCTLENIYDAIIADPVFGTGGAREIPISKIDDKVYFFPFGLDTDYDAGGYTTINEQTLILGLSQFEQSPGEYCFDFSKLMVGTKYGDTFGQHGGQIYLRTLRTGVALINWTGESLLYDVILSPYTDQWGNATGSYFAGGVGEYINCTFNQESGYYGAGTYYDCVFSSPRSVITYVNGTMNDCYWPEQPTSYRFGLYTSVVNMRGVNWNKPTGTPAVVFAKINTNASTNSTYTFINPNPAIPDQDDPDCRGWDLNGSNGAFVGWNGYEKFDISVKAIDENGEPVPNAVLYVRDKDGVYQVNGELSDNSGEFTLQTIATKHFFYSASDPITEPYYDSVVSKLLNPMVIMIKKAGYKTYRWNGTIDEKIDWSKGIVLEKSIYPDDIYKGKNK